MMQFKKLIFLILGIIVLFSIKGLYTLDNKNIGLKELTKNFRKKYLHFDGPAKYAKMHQILRTRENEDKPQYKSGYLLEEFKKAKESLSYRNGKKLKWIERGPTNAGGRTRALIVDPDDSTHHTFFAGTVGGGIWKSSNGGDSWKNLTPNLPNLSTSTLAMSKNNTNVIYAGTGEGFGNFETVRGSGIWKSKDKGKSWEVLLSTFDNEYFLNVLRLIVNPENENELLACTMGSDVSLSYIMKSIDGGESWTEKFKIQGSTIQQIVYTPNNFSIMYASANGNSVLKSSDAGETWEKVFDLNTYDVNRMELAVSPVNPDNIFLSCEVAGGSKLLVTKDAFKTVNSVLFSGEVQANWLGGQGWYDNTIAAHPYDENTVWVAGSGSMMEIKTDSVEKDIKVFKQFRNNTVFLAKVKTEQIPIDGDGLASDFLGQIFLDPKTTEDDLIDVEVRFGVGKKQKAHFLNFDFFTYSMTYGTYGEVPFEAWDIKNNKQISLSIIDLNGDGKWNFEDYSDNPNATPDIIFVNNFDYSEEPNDIVANSNVVYKAEYYFYKGKRPSFNGTIDSLPESNVQFLTEVITGSAATFAPITDGYFQYFNVSPVGSKGVHVDHHNIILIPTDTVSKSFYVLNANDGGVAFSEDGGKTFKQTGDTFLRGNSDFETSDGYNVSQFYGVDKMNGGNRYIGGTQDNGSWVSPLDPDKTTKWKSAPSGDGFEAAWNYRDTNQILESSQYNNISKSTDGGNTWRSINLPDVEGPFVTRIASSQLDPDLVFLGSSDGLLKSTDFGDTWEIKDMPGRWSFSFTGPPIAISLADANVVWTGSAISSKSRVVVSFDKGETWEETSNYKKATMGNLSGIATHPKDENTAYVLFSQANGPKILKTVDKGETWVDISGFNSNRKFSSNGFPNVATYSLLVMPFDTNKIWAGTEIGLFESLDGGKTWHYSDNGLPAVGIWQMKIVNDQIVLATHGRGVWTVNVSEVVASNEVTFINDKFEIYPNPILQSATITFEVKKKQNVNLSIYSLDGKLINTLIDGKISGSQKVSFNRNGLVSGSYLISLKTINGISTKKIILQ